MSLLAPNCHRIDNQFPLKSDDDAYVPRTGLENAAKNHVSEADSEFATPVVVAGRDVHKINLTESLVKNVWLRRTQQHRLPVKQATNL